MHWDVVILRNQYPAMLEYPDVPEDKVMGLIRGHFEDPHVSGFEVNASATTRRTRHAPTTDPQPYPMAA